MFFTQLPDMPEDMSDELIDQSNKWLQDNLSSEVWTTSQIDILFGISAARLNQLHKKYKINGHVQLGVTHLYIAKYAKPWFEKYKAKVTENKIAKEKKPAGRPKKDLNAWRNFTYKDVEYKIGEDYANPYLFIQHQSVLFMKNLTDRGIVYGMPEFAEYIEWMKGFKEASGYNKG